MVKLINRYRLSRYIFSGILISLFIWAIVTLCLPTMKKELIIVYCFFSALLFLGGIGVSVKMCVKRNRIESERLVVQVFSAYQGKCPEEKCSNICKLIYEKTTTENYRHRVEALEATIKSDMATNGLLTLVSILLTLAKEMFSEKKEPFLNFMISSREVFVGTCFVVFTLYFLFFIRLIECESFILSIISTLPVYRDELEKKYSIVPPYVEKKNVKNIVGRYEVHLISENDKEEINYLININPELFMNI